MTDSTDNMREEPADTYGKHSRPYAQGSSVRQLLLRFIRAGEPIRLAWSTTEPIADQREEFPTAVLPVFSGEPQAAPPASLDPEQGNNDQDLGSEPTSAMRQARRWLNIGHGYRLRGPKSLLG